MLQKELCVGKTNNRIRRSAKVLTATVKLSIESENRGLDQLALGMSAGLLT